jgi:hypothetical protein
MGGLRMTVDELIEKLAQYPGDWDVVYDDYDSTNGYFDIDYVFPGRIDEKFPSRFEYQEEGKYMAVNAVKLC